MVTRLAPNYQWADFQKDASENKIEDIFREILPGSDIYSENYYFLNNDKRQRYENDLLVIFEDILLIVEIKAGSFVYTPPITDFETHIKSYQNLIEKADKQCSRTLDYFLSSEKSKIFEESGEEKSTIDMSKIRDFFTISVTIDNINSLAAKAEKMQFLELNSNTLSISLDELLVYRDYFNSPLYFLHFLKERKKATQIDKLALNDELDHLGLYIEHNTYSEQISLLPGDYLAFTGYREELDFYFSSLIHTNLEYEKPIQNIPLLFQEMIFYLGNDTINNKVEKANFLLDFTFDFREQITNSINYTFERQKEVGTMIGMNSWGSTPYSYSIFVNQPGIKKATLKEKEDYTLSSLLWNEEENRILMDIFFDKKHNFKKVEFYKYQRDEIEEKEIERLRKMGEDNANKRIAQYMKRNPGKIGRNEVCPCGTGKKYKKCCLKRTR